MCVCVCASDQRGSEEVGYRRRWCISCSLVLQLHMPPLLLPLLSAQHMYCSQLHVGTCIYIHLVNNILRTFIGTINPQQYTVMYIHTCTNTSIQLFFISMYTCMYTYVHVHTCIATIIQCIICTNVCSTYISVMSTPSPLCSRHTYVLTFDLCEELLQVESHIG